MTKKYIIAAVIILLVSVIAYQFYINNQTPNDPDTSAAAYEKQTTYITKAYEKDGEVYIDADYIQFATESNGGCTYHDPENPNQNTKPECGPNGYTIVNSNNKIRTFKLSPRTIIRPITEDGVNPDQNFITPKEFLTKKDPLSGHNLYAIEINSEPYYHPFILTLQNNEVVEIIQQYIP